MPYKYQPKHNMLKILQVYERRGLLLLLLIIVGCNSGCNTQPLTPQQRGFLLGYMQNQQAQYQQQAYQNQQAVQQAWANATNTTAQNFYPTFGGEDKSRPQAQQNAYNQNQKATEEPKLPYSFDQGRRTGKTKIGPDGTMWVEVKYSNGAIAWVRY